MQNERYTEADDEYASRRRQARRGPGLPTVWCVLLGLQWLVITWWAMTILREGPLSGRDYALCSLGGSLSLFYFWVAFGIYRRKKYIFDFALVCAWLGILSFPVGTLISLVLLSNLMSKRHIFTK